MPQTQQRLQPVGMGGDPLSQALPAPIGLSASHGPKLHGSDRALSDRACTRVCTEHCRHEQFASLCSHLTPLHVELAMALVARRMLASRRSTWLTCRLTTLGQASFGKRVMPAQSRSCMHLPLVFRLTPYA